LKFYKRKNTIFYENKKLDFEFLRNLAQACMGGGGSSESVDVDSGEGLEEITDDQEALLRAALGDDYDTMYGDK
jgi:hypothetical protein